MKRMMVPVLGLAILLLGLLGNARPAMAGGCTGSYPSQRLWTANGGGLYQIKWGDSVANKQVQFWNYEFPSECPTRKYVENAIDIIFDPHASIPKIEDDIGKSTSGCIVSGTPLQDGILPCNGLGENAYAQIANGDGQGYRWWASKGYKDVPGGPTVATDYHLRLYATNELTAGYSYSLKDQFFVIGAFHEDHHENFITGAGTFGDSENAKRWFAGQVNSTDVSSKSGWWHALNPHIPYDMKNEAYGRAGNERWEDSGYAAEIVMCPSQCNTPTPGS